LRDASLYADTPLLNECPYLKEVLNTFKCNLMAVRLLKLSAGTQIHEHKDADLCFEEGLVRFHIPVITDPDVEFFLDKERMILSEGDCWYMNFNLPHALHNKSNIDRIHLVIDAVSNEWVSDLFKAPTIMNKKEIEGSKNIYDDATKKEIIFQLRAMGTAVANKLADEMEAG
jgi:quercetin dioxygenase-like cupin family protein